jgi:hypothetical protein
MVGSLKRLLERHDVGMTIGRGYTQALQAWLGRGDVHQGTVHGAGTGTIQGFLVFVTEAMEMQSGRSDCHS